MPHDYYETLGVSRSASADEIKKAYRKLSRQYHPDVKPGDKAAEAKFKEVQTAYAVVGDPDKRKKYDQFGHAFEGAGGAGPGGFQWGGPGGGPVDFEQIFGGGGIDLGDLFGGAFGGGGRGRGRRQTRAQRGQDIEKHVVIPFALAAEGGQHDITVFAGESTETLTVRIPAGIESGQTIRLAGQGQPGLGGGPNGDLRLTLTVAPHRYFRREGSHIFVDVPVTIAEAILGAKVDVPTLSEGLVSLSIPAGTSSGAKLRLRGKGVPDPKTQVRGDQFAVVKIVVPKGVDDASRELIDQFAQRNPQQPRDGHW